MTVLCTLSDASLDAPSAPNHLCHHAVADLGATGEGRGHTPDCWGLHEAPQQGEEAAMSRG